MTGEHRSQRCIENGGDLLERHTPDVPEIDDFSIRAFKGVEGGSEPCHFGIVLGHW